jgi:predicted nucleic acid-binding protein
MEGSTMIVSNSTPLINFAAINRLDILESLFGTVVIPPAVEYEVLECGHRYPSVTAIREATFIARHAIGNAMLRDALIIDLDPGEAEAIILALEQKADLLLLDEIAGRTIAESYQLAFTGSIGCLIEAKRAGIIPAVRPLLDAMRQEARFWLHPRLYARILLEQGE